MFKLIIAAILIVTVRAVDFEIRNNDGGDIWIGIQGNPGKENLANGGFILGSKQSRTLKAAADWAGRFWARTWCNPSTGFCLTGDCGGKLECQGAGGVPPASLAEITLGGAGGLDYYDLSFVDGFNIVLTFEPVDGAGDGSQYSCKRASCSFHLNDECPSALRVNSEHGVVACKSACAAFDTDEYCCRNAHDRPETCRSSDWPVDYPYYFKSHCPDAYSYAYDDNKSTFTCRAQKYLITFGG
ncbi:hypothetical protein NQ314_010508 [Rhamnusium bicolor]|uniref:Uncharacterized protein n=1 Tax=Rhamnusium bicolor TaxID=1586634 RepID=A0AAV8XPP3_9CUCU|nr:hypothetical protein NQ314_010508 [Rhamnusium bicolor]